MTSSSLGPPGPRPIARGARASGRSLALVVLASLPACAAVIAPPAPSMTVPEHEAAALREEALAEAQEARRDPEAKSPRRCGGLTDGAHFPPACWRSRMSSDDERRRVAEAHRRAAADHRAAAENLRRIEARACAGLAAEDRDQSPFELRRDIERVQPLGSAAEVVGATVVFKAAPGMTVEWLQRIIDCQVTRHAVLGRAQPDAATSPLAPPGVEAAVAAVAGGFAVTIRSEDPATSREILRRARALLGADAVQDRR